MGKTHVLTTIAAGNAAFVGTAVYRAQNDLPFLDVYLQPTDDFSFTSYGAMLVTTLCLSLGLLRVGPKAMYKYYFGATIALLLGLALFGGETALYWTLAMLVFAFGSLFPDIDEERSTLGRYVPVISRNIPHRTFTHTVWLLIPLYGLAWYLGNPFLFAFALGAMCHIIEDSFSKQGICWFYPVIGKYDSYGGGAVKKRGRKTTFAYATGGLFETVALYGSFALNLVAAAYYFYNG